MSSALQDPPTPGLSSRQFLRLLRPFIAPHRLLLAGIGIGLLIEAGFMTALSMSLKVLVDQAIMPQNLDLLMWLLGALFGAVALASVVMLWRDWLYARLGTLVVHGIRQRLFGHLQSLSLDFFSRAPAGSLMARFTTDLAAIEQVVVLSLPNIVSSALNISFLLAAMVYLHPPLAALACLMLPLCWIGPRALLPAAARAGSRAREREAEVLGAVQENLAAQASIKSFAGETEAVRQFSARLDRYSHSSLRFNFLSFAAERMPNVAMILTHCVLLAVGSSLVFDGQLTIGTLVAFHSLLLSLSAVIATLSANFPALLHAATGMQRIGELLAERPAVVEKADALELAPMRSAIAFDQVSHSRGGRTIIDRLSFQIARGSTVALVGPSGSGKSTVLSLLARMGDPEDGRIVIDGNDLRDLRLASLRRQMSMVLQHNTLMEMSVRENIRLARPDASDADVEVAAIAAVADGFIRELPNGYDSALGAAGVHLSGGQRQRIAIAQALLRRAPILLLDEATSALDPATERELSVRLSQADGDRTTIMVTHNLEQASLCQQILVLDQGRLVEQGSHTELLAKGGLYAHLWRRQHGVAVSDDLEHAHLSREWLSELALFKGACPELLDELAAAFSVQRCNAGDQILRQGDPGERFYVIGHGSVAVSRRSQFRKEAELARLHAGDAFGEAALLSAAPRNASVRALGDCVLLTLDRAQFRLWLERDPQWQRSMRELSAARAVATPDTRRRHRGDQAAAGVSSVTSAAA